MASAKNEARIKFTAETQEFTAAIQSANSQMSSLRAEMKLAEATFKNTGNSAEYMESKTKILEAQLQANAEKQEALTQKLEAAKAIYGENSAEAEAWATKLTRAKTEQQNLETQLQQCNQEINEQTAAEEKAQTPLEQLNSTIAEQRSELERLKTDYKNVALESGSESTEAQELKAKIDQLNSELGENEAKLKEVDSALDDAGESAESAANGGWTVFKGVVADLASNAIQQGIDKIKEFGKETVQLGIDFSSSMSNVQAISGATGDEMEQLEQSARNLGATTVFSASDVSDAFGYMAMAGWKTNDMLSGIDGVLNLAAASGEDLATTSDIVTDALTAFGMEAGEAGRLADVMAAASSNANTNVSMLGESFKYVAPVAGSMGYSAEDTAAALGLMANAGIKASSGGTALRTVLTNLSKPTEQMQKAMDQLGVSLTDDEGNMYSLHEVMDQLREGFFGLQEMTDEQKETLAALDQDLADGCMTTEDYEKAVDELVGSTDDATGATKAQVAAMLAGKTGMSGLMAIVNASESDYAKLTDAIDGSAGAAEEMADTMQDNLGGDIKELNSAMEEFKLKIYDAVENPMRETVQFITGSVIPAATQVLQFIQQHSVAFGILGAAIGVITAAVIAHNAVQAIKTAMNTAEAASLGALISAQVAATATSWAALAPYILIVAAIAAVIAIIVICVKHWDQIRDAILKASEVIRSKATELWNKLRTAISNVVTGIRTKVVSIWTNIRNTTTNIWNNIRSGIQNAITGARNIVTNITTAIRSKIVSIWTGIRSATSTAWNFIRTAITNPISTARNLATNAVTNLKNKLTSTFENLKSKVASVWNGIRDAINNPIETAKKTVENVVSRIKGIFPIKLGKIMNLKIPKIHIDGGKVPYGIGGMGTPPHISVDWHRLGAIFHKPTLIPALNGIHGVGEAGAEAVSPISTLQDYVSQSVRDNVPAIDYDRLGASVARACAGMDIRMELNHRELGRVVREVV